MKKLYTGLLLIISVSLAAVSQDTLSYVLEARLLVHDRQSASSLLTGWAEAQGGYYTRSSLDQVELRLPDEAVSSLRAYLNEISEDVIEYNQMTTDLREQILASRSALDAREEILEKNLQYIDDSDVEGTLTLEQEIRRLMTEIDQQRGLLRKLNNDSRYARVNIYLSFRNQTLPENRPSRFDWINTVSFYDFMQSDMSYDVRGWGSVSVDIPGGFALVDKSPQFRALSPEGVRFRVRKEKNYPQQSAEFWQEALFRHLEESGYTPWGGAGLLEGSFTVRQWAVPWGRDDYLFICGIRLVKGNIEIVEIAGPARYVRQYFPL